MDARRCLSDASLLACALLALPTAALAAITNPGEEAAACAPSIPVPAQPGASPGIALSLAGGGTKASSFAMGVLSAAVDTPLRLSADPSRFDKSLFWQSDAVSSVSGGSYAAFYVYSRLIRNRVPGRESAGKDIGRYFRDCIPDTLASSLQGFAVEEAARRGVTADVLFCPQPVSIGKEGDLPRQAAVRHYWNTVQPDTRHQQFVRCHADILTWQRCEFSNSSGAKVRSYTTYGALGLASMLSLPMAWTANTIFDWPVNLSPSRVVYREGIGMAYGLEPLDARALEGDAVWAAQVGAVRNFVTADGETSLADFVPRSPDDGGFADREAGLRIRPDPDHLTFEGLNALYQDGSLSPPRWIINATAAPSRSILGWAGQNDTNFDRDIFHMTGAQQCAGSVGPILIDKAMTDVESADNSLPRGSRHASLLTAVNASAAFFDSNQRVLGQPFRFIGGVLQHVANLNWGIDVRNVDEHGKAKTSEIRRGIHLALPVPLYLGESYAGYVSRRDPVYVRLVDGGSSDNLGAYGPIVESVKDLIVSDHAEDKGGSMGDLCLLRNELLIRRGLHLHIPGLAEWPRGCLDSNVLRRSRMRSEDTTPAAKAAFAELEAQATAREVRGESLTVSYPIWGWPYPFLAGCVSDSANPDSCLTAPRTRLWIVKPAFDYPDWLRSQTSDKGPGERRAITRCGGMTELPCESSAFLAYLLKDKEYYNNEWDTPIFPQDSTVAMTINSSANLVGAYRELGKHYTKLAIAELDQVRMPGGEARFRALLCRQAAYPIIGSLSDKSFRLAPTIFDKSLDLSLDHWYLAERDKARISEANPLASRACDTLGLQAAQ